MPIIINGGSRRAGGWWAKHLENGEKNEKVSLVEVVGLNGTTATELFREMYAMSRGSESKATNYFYQANINPRDDERLTPQQRHEAKETLLKNLGLEGQPHFVYEHEKKGRLHIHVVAFRIDLETQRAIPDSLTAVIHEKTSRELEIKFDLERGKSILVKDRDFDRPDRRAKKRETFRATETGIDPEKVKADARQHWQSADNGKSFKAALEASGDYVLARGDRRDFVIIDRVGDDHSLGRRLGVKAAEVRARMADLDPANLPSVEQAKEIQRARTAERARAAEIDRAAQAAMQAAHTGARGKYDSLRETEREVSRDQFPGRYDDLRAAEPPPEVVREFESSANRAAEPVAPIHDRDADNAAWEAKLADAAINAEAQKARQQPGDSAGRETRAGVAEPSGDAGSRPDAELWDELSAWNADARSTRADGIEEPRAADVPADHTPQEIFEGIEDALHTGTRAASRLTSGLAKAVENILGGIFSFFGGGEPKLSPLQRQREAQANGELAEARAAAAAAQEKEADLDWIIFQQDRQRRQEEQDIETGHRERPGDPGLRGDERERERDWGRD